MNKMNKLNKMNKKYKIKIENDLRINSLILINKI